MFWQPCCTQTKKTFDKLCNSKKNLLKVTSLLFITTISISLDKLVICNSCKEYSFKRTNLLFEVFVNRTRRGIFMASLSLYAHKLN